jgi:hypothetical protein
VLSAFEFCLNSFYPVKSYPYSLAHVVLGPGSRAFSELTVCALNAAIRVENNSADRQRLPVAMRRAGRAVSSVLIVELKRRPMLSRLHRSIAVVRYSQLLFLRM